MKLHFFRWFAVGVILSAAIFGRIKRNSYTDLRKEENYMEQLMVAELPEEIAITACSDMLKDLPNSPIILRVIASEDMEHIFGAGRQKVSIQEIYAGNNLGVGQEIYLYYNSGRLILREGEDKSVELNFVNVMREGREYLVFISHKVDALNEPIPIYQLNRDVISPIFSYEEPKSRVIIPVGEGSTYVPYIQVKDNEFFATSEKAFDAWDSLKSEMLLAYPNKY